MNADTLNHSNAVDAARYYLKQGFKVHPVPRKGNHKAPVTKHWPTHDFTVQEFEEHQNVGVRLDLDMKCADKLTPFPGRDAS